jgi:hypothetical protein
MTDEVIHAGAGYKVDEQPSNMMSLSRMEALLKAATSYAHAPNEVEKARAYNELSRLIEEED